ncbi:hypothetical protein CspeluHIS016_0600460 [Cutaneotrichosporon spelunceum]|uniref:FAD/NAD(P)-binding domain-containing protein n=1 Tax=Cutaneotrichosporon spelunceum TaxID=1672016 RepID=A0AAD3TXF7_9TREE|nr:hypothetical protein CspeluHIS016_0600460 [Cutaneotrichosporon spelunceum]
MGEANQSLASFTLPTHQAGYAPPAKVDVAAEAGRFIADLTKASDGDAFAALFHPDGFWRDSLVFTRDFRTNSGTQRIAQAAKATFESTQATEFALAPEGAKVDTPFPDLTFLTVRVTFSSVLGPGYAVARLTYKGGWKVFTLYTALTGVHGHTQRVGEERVRGTHNDKEPFDTRRARQTAHETGDPDVLIIGAGHNGLTVAAQCKSFGLDALCIDREKRIGDNWRLRYSSLSLHDPVYTNHLPFMPFPSTWPTFTPAGKLANWLESYTDALDLDVWTQATTDPARTRYNPDTGVWDVTVLRTQADGSVSERVMHVRHIVLATGIAGGEARLPPPKPGQDGWEGTAVHSSRHPGGAASKGKRVLVVGAATSGHDIAMDLVQNGAQVTMLQRSPTFIMSIKNGTHVLQAGLFNDKTDIEFADMTARSMPMPVVREFQKRSTAWLSTVDAELLTGLKKAGFRTYPGPDGAGFWPLAVEKAGGYYFDTGASQMIISRDIKVRQGEIASFGPGKTVRFADGKDDDEFDEVIFATGYGGYQDTVARSLGDEAAAQLTAVYGTDAEGEIRGIARDCGIPNVMFNVGNLASSRTFSKNIALQIVLQREGKLGERYTMAKQAAEV